jgi:hypothetical protein
MIAGLMQLCFNFFCMFSGQTLFNSVTLLGYNTVFTGLGVLFYIFDVDVPTKNFVLTNPEFYWSSQYFSKGNFKLLAQFMLRAVWQGCVALFGARACMRWLHALAAFRFVCCIHMFGASTCGPTSHRRSSLCSSVQWTLQDGAVLWFHRFHPLPLPRRGSKRLSRQPPDAGLLCFQHCTCGARRPPLCPPRYLILTSIAVHWCQRSGATRCTRAVRTYVR